MRWSLFSALAKAAIRFGLAAAFAPCAFSAPATEAPGEIKDIRGPIEMPEDPVWPFYAWAGAAAAALAGGSGYVIRRRRAAARAAAAAAAMRPKPADEEALDALAALDAADQKIFYTQLTGIVRVYLARRFAVDEPDATSSELLAAVARTREVGKEHQHLLRRLFAEADLVKFAGARRDTQAPAIAVEQARRFVRETTPEVAHAF